VKEQSQVLEELAELKTSLGFVGHTHKPFVYCNGQYFEKALLNQAFKFDIGANNKFFANPGSVGQPRDKDTRSSFGILCLNQKLQVGIFRIFRVRYDVMKTVEKIKKAGLPEDLALRLLKGL
jgi:diadenosine tetraphosphatase ApaH/serine/threonine PP2A family protein phosphatase